MSDSKATTAEPALKVVLEQALDDGLWFVAETITEQYLQSALRRLHFAVESAHPPAAPEGLERFSPDIDGEMGCEYATMETDPDGEYTRYNQAAALLQSREATIEGLRAELAERDGWVLVPVEPTEAMLNAANDVSGSQRGSWDDRMAAQYKAMLAALAARQGGRDA